MADASIWTPDEAVASNYAALVNASTSPDFETQRRVREEVQRLQSTMSDYAAYLMYTFVQGAAAGIHSTAAAGFMIKNHIGLHYDTLPPPVLAYVRQAAFPLLASPSDLVRRSAISVLTMLIEIGLNDWPQGIASLIQLMNSDNIDEMEAAFRAFAILTEDIGLQLESLTIEGAKPIDVLIPGWIQAATYTEPRVRVLALESLNFMADLPSATLQMHIDAFVAALTHLATDEDANVRRCVCQAFLILLNTRFDKLEPHLDGVVDYMLYLMQEESEAVNLTACTFFLEFAENRNLIERLQPYLPKVIPALLRSMVYTDDDLTLLGADEDDADVPDRPEDIAPHHVGSAMHSQERNQDVNQLPGGDMPKQNNSDDPDDEDDFDNDEDDDDEDDEGAGLWNLRKCSASTLDVLAVEFPDDILGPLLPLLHERLFSEDWRQREVAILALGAVAGGATNGIAPHLPTLIPLLLTILTDRHSLLRSITCWTLGRYVNWCLGDGSEPHVTNYFVPLLEGLLRMLVDRVKRVQEAGCSAFATLAEDSGSAIVPYLVPACQTLARALGMYQRKNLIVLCDAIGTMSESAGSALNEPEVSQVILPPLMNKYQQLENDDPGLLPVLECLCSVTISVGPGFAPYAPGLFSRCMELIEEVMQRYEAGQVDIEWDDDMDFVTVALDVLSGLLQGLGTETQQLIVTLGQKLMPLVIMCLQLPVGSVRQSVSALLGDLAIYAFPQLRPSLPIIMPHVLTTIEHMPQDENISICNNAAWAVGEIALQYGPDPELKQWILPLSQRLIPLLLNPRSPKSLSENAAVTLGRLGLVAPEEVAPHLELFAQPWCFSLWDIKDNIEKDSAFRGFCRMVEINPNAIVKSFAYFCMAIVRWQTPSRELNDQFARILTGFRDMMGPEQWESAKTQFTPFITERLTARYGL